MKAGRISLLAAIVLCGAAPLAQAVTCGASTAGLAFGAYNLLSPSPLTANATVRITCSLQPSDGPAQRVVAFPITLSQGWSNSFATRQMGSGANRLNYNVFTTNTYTTVWGDGSGGTQVLGVSFTLNPAFPTRFRDLTGYGRVPALQDVAAGSYQDALLVTLTF